MYNCPKCQIPFEKGTSFCQGCGYHLAAEFLIEPICPACKKEFPDGSKFCDVDGSKLTTKDKLVPKCVVCGKEYPGDVKFCPADGGAIIAEAYRLSTSKNLQQKSSAAGMQNFGHESQNATSSLTVSELNKKFEWFTWLYWGGLLGCLIIIGIFPLIAAFIIGFIMQHQAWSLIQSMNPRTTPGKAVGFQFIPLFNFYWFFVAYRGLAIDINKFISVNEIPSSKMNENFGLATAILMLLINIPYLNVLALIGYIVVYFLFMKELKASMIAIIEHNLREGI